MNMNFIRKNIQSCKTCYNKENDSSKCLGCVTHGDDISDFRLKPEIDEYLSELERLSTIGRYTEMAFSEPYPEFNFGIDEDNINIVEIKEFIQWGNNVDLEQRFTKESEQDGK